MEAFSLRHISLARAPKAEAINPLCPRKLDLQRRPQHKNYINHVRSIVFTILLSVSHTLLHAPGNTAVLKIEKIRVQPTYSFDGDNDGSRGV